MRRLQHLEQQIERYIYMGAIPKSLPIFIKINRVRLWSKRVTFTKLREGRFRDASRTLITKIFDERTDKHKSTQKTKLSRSVKSISSILMRWKQMLKSHNTLTTVVKFTFNGRNTYFISRIICFNSHIYVQLGSYYDVAPICAYRSI